MPNRRLTCVPSQNNTVLHHMSQDGKLKSKWENNQDLFYQAKRFLQERKQKHAWSSPLRVKGRSRKGATYLPAHNCKLMLKCSLNIFQRWPKINETIKGWLIYLRKALLLVQTTEIKLLHNTKLASNYSSLEWITSVNKSTEFFIRFSKKKGEMKRKNKWGKGDSSAFPKNKTHKTLKRLSSLNIKPP